MFPPRWPRWLFAGGATPRRPHPGRGPVDVPLLDVPRARMTSLDADLPAQVEGLAPLPDAVRDAAVHARFEHLKRHGEGVADSIELKRLKAPEGARVTAYAHGTQVLLAENPGPLPDALRDTDPQRFVASFRGEGLEPGSETHARLTRMGETLPAEAVEIVEWFAPSVQVAPANEWDFGGGMGPGFLRMRQFLQGGVEEKAPEGMAWTVGGCFEPLSRSLNLSPMTHLPMELRATDGTHETMHLLSYALGLDGESLSESPEWLDLFERTAACEDGSLAFPTAYAATDAEEFFAECATAYLRPLANAYQVVTRADLQRLNPEAHAFMERLFAEGIRRRREDGPRLQGPDDFGLAILRDVERIPEPERTAEDWLYLGYIQFFRACRERSVEGLDAAARATGEALACWAPDEVPPLATELQASIALERAWLQEI